MKPEKEINGLVFYPVPEFSDVNIAFGAEEKSFFNRRELPDVPSKYEDMASSLMFSGGTIEKLSDKIDQKKAFRAVSSWLSSFAPAHEAKIATVGYALWLWSTEEALA